MLSADEIIRLLELTPHPEGGYFRETFRDEAQHAGRAYSTAIYYLLKAGDVSHWHRVDAVETWHWYAGSPLVLKVSSGNVAPEEHVLGSGFGDCQRPQIVVPKGHWQSARSLGDWTLAGCTVAPGFEFSGFEMAPDGWEPVEAS